jgi:hypothetical protein
MNWPSPRERWRITFLTFTAIPSDFKPKLRNSKDSRRWAEDEAALNLLKAATPAAPSATGEK